eukprot:scaffold151515_cov52-Attheya_sp.AAC.1
MVSAAGGCCGGENRFSHNPVSRQNGGRAQVHAPVAVFLTGTSWEWHNTTLAIYVDGRWSWDGERLERIEFGASISCRRILATAGGYHAACRSLPCP